MAFDDLELDPFLLEDDLCERLLLEELVLFELLDDVLDDALLDLDASRRPELLRSEGLPPFVLILALPLCCRFVPLRAHRLSSNNTL